MYTATKTINTINKVGIKKENTASDKICSFTNEFISLLFKPKEYLRKEITYIKNTEIMKGSLSPVEETRKKVAKLLLSFK